MGWHATAYLLADEGALLDGYTHRQGLVLIRLAHYVNEYPRKLDGTPNLDYGWARPSLGLLARSAPKVGRNAARDTLALAVRCGLIESDGVRYRNATRYRFPGLILDPSPLEGTGQTATRSFSSATRSPLRGTRSEGEVKPSEVKRGRLAPNGATTAARDSGSERAAIAAHFIALQALDGERVTWTPARDRAAGHALRRGCTVEQCCTALTNAHREHGGLSADGLRCDDGGRLSCDVPHVLHEDRIGAALAGTFSIDWTDPPPFTPRRSPRDNRNTEGTVIR